MKPLIYEFRALMAVVLLDWSFGMMPDDMKIRAATLILRLADVCGKTRPEERK